jgi:hypothetical protein
MGNNGESESSNRTIAKATVTFENGVVVGIKNKL